MTRWSDARKKRLQRPALLDPVQQLEIRVGRRICRIVYGGNCACEAQGRNMVCDNMRIASQHAFAEIRGE